jgi:glycyl-tRNA synthetase
MAETSANPAADRMEKIVSLCRRRGFVFQSSEIYGGLNGCWDYGPLGAELKRNIKSAWWDAVVRQRDDMVGLDCSILMHPLTWKSSGHLDGFNDPMVDCLKCRKRYRADKLTLLAFLEKGKEDGPPKAVWTLETDSVEEALATKLSNTQAKKLGDVVRKAAPFMNPGVPADWPRDCPDPACGGKLTAPRQFNLMLKTFVGAMEESAATTYLRPETAQGIFANFKNVVDSSRVKVPFGIAQIGKSFRNEINPRNFTFRSREFEQMEIEFFCKPGTEGEWYAHWKKERYEWYINLGMKRANLHMRDHEGGELAHYARACVDIEYDFPFGRSELEGIASRTDFDLRQHQRGMRAKAEFDQGKPAMEIKLPDEDKDWAKGPLSYFDDETKERYVPYVVEPSAGADRATLAFLCDAYDEDTAPNEKGEPETRTVLRFHPKLAPITVAVLPLVKKDGLPEIAEPLYRDLKKRGFAAAYDEKVAIGRRYRRQDEIGTPFCVTVDGQTKTDNTVTIRDRDTLKQERIGIDKVADYITDRLRK